MLPFEIKLESDDVIAIVLIAACLILKVLGKDSIVDTTLLGIAAYYFGHKRLKIKRKK